jgi:hypothetical protein
MKKVFLLLAPVICLLISCGNSKTNETTSSVSGTKEVQLKINGNPLSISTPSDSTKGKLEITLQSWGATEITLGKDFKMSIEEGAGDIQLTKSDIAGDEVFKLKRYLKDEPTLLFWESKNADLPDSKFHFYMINKIGAVSYIIKDVESGDSFNEKAIQTMIDAAKTLKVSTKPNS